LRPDLSLESLQERLGAPRKGQSASNFLRKSAGLSPVAIALLREASPTLPVEPEALARLIKAVPLMLTGTKSLDRAISSAGGVPFADVDGHLMLRRMPGVFVAGEMLDWEAPTGGYLLQATFATGIAAAKGVLAQIKIPDAALTLNPSSATPQT
ncbi:MAG: NAD(P)/FAD-dependent oxidoreductase, partial [Microvirga sp.]